MHNVFILSNIINIWIL